MNRFLSCLVSVVLVVGLLPVPAFAAGDLRAEPLELPSETVGSVGAVDATFADQNLYDAVVAQLKAQGIACTADDARKNIRLTAASNAELTKLDLSNKTILDISGIEGFTALTWLDLSHNLVKTTSQLAGMTALTHLDLHDNAVHDLSGLSGLKALTWLDLGENNEVGSKAQLSGLEALEELTNLVYLDFSANRSPEVLPHLKGLVNLEYLNLQQGESVKWKSNSAEIGVRDLDDLAGLVNMKTLVLSHNCISGVAALKDMGQLEELVLHDNTLYRDNGASDTSGLAAAFDDAGNLTWPKLKKIDISSNTEWKVRTDGAAGKLFDLDQAGKLELGYSFDRLFTYDDAARDGYDAHVKRGAKLADLPHVDAANVKYVTYDDFGARCREGFDDFTAMVNAHAFANERGCEVRAVPGKTYHIYKRYNSSWYGCFTNVDWQGANFVVHDEFIETTPSRFVPLMCFRPSGAGRTEKTSAYEDRVTLDDPGITLDKATTRLSSPAFDAALAELNAKGAEKGYSRYYVMAYDSTTKHYIRFGQNANRGSDTWDGLVIDGQGNLISKPGDAAANKVQWDFNKVTKVVITPIPDDPSYVRNGHFTHTVPERKQETPYGRGGGKGGYYYRNIQVRECANVEVANITDTVDDHDELSGSYYSFLEVRDCAEVNLHDCDLFARKFSKGGRSTYGLVLNNDTGITLTNVKSNGGDEAALADSHRWGVMGNNRCKDITFDRCVVNRIDAHEGYYNMKALDCTVGHHGFTLIGQGPLVIERTEVTATNFITLRYDYGGTWDGDARIVDCTHHAIGADTQGVIGAYREDVVKGVSHWFGYDLRFPNLSIENLTVDETGRTPGKDAYYIVPNHASGNYAASIPESFWPESVEVDGIDFVNYEGSLGFEPQFRLTSCEVGTIARKLPGYSARNVTFNGTGGHAGIGAGANLLSEATAISTDAEVASENSVQLRLVLDALAGKELAVWYAGTLPRLALMDDGWHGWTTVDAYDVEKGADGNVAYFSASAVAAKWAAKEGTAWTDANGNSGKVGALSRVYVIVDSVTSGGEKFEGTAELSSVALVPATGRIDLSKVSVKLAATSYPFDGTAKTPAVTVTYRGRTLRKGASADYTVTYQKGRTNAGTYAVTVKGVGDYKGTVEKTFKITAKKATPTVALSPATFAYDGKTHKPKVVVKVAGKTLTTADYALSLPSGRKNVGTYTVKATLKRNYSGSKSVSFKVNPARPKLASVKAARRGFTVRWARQAAQTTGFQVQYATAKGFKGAKTVVAKGPKTASKAVTKLKPKKKYWVRVRAYKQAGGKTYYSAWSAAKTVTTRK